MIAENDIVIRIWYSNCKAVKKYDDWQCNICWICVCGKISGYGLVREEDAQTTW